MLEHRKKVRRKTSDVEVCISKPSGSTESYAPLTSKYSAVIPSCAQNCGVTHNVSKSEEPRSGSSSPINHIVIDSDTDYSLSDGECGDKDSVSCTDTTQHSSEGISQEAIRRKLSATSVKYRRRRELPQKGSDERAEVLKRDAKRRIQESAGKYSCPHCDYSAPFPSKVKRHIASKHSDSHVCSECNMRFDAFSMLRKHISSEHPKLHHCEYCSFSNKIKAAVRKHTVENHENGIMCTVPGCNIRVARRRLKAHIEKEHPLSQPAIAPGILETETPTSQLQDPLLKCSHCSFDTNDVDDYNKHVLSAHEIGIECPMPDCSTRFLLGDMDSHFSSLHSQSAQNDALTDKFAESNTTTTPSECVSTSYCSDSPCPDFDNFNTPKKPRGRSERSSEGFHCSLCGKNYGDCYLLRKHIRRVHERSYAEYSRPLKYVCDWPDCEKAFTTSGLLQDHINTHRGVKPYRCDNCGSSFSARARFAVHLSKYHRMSIRDYSNVSGLLKSTTDTSGSEPHQ